MPDSAGSMRDLLAAVAIGAAMESLLTWRAYVVQNRLTERHFWLEMSQMPAFDIAQRIARDIGYFQALAFILVFQATLYALITLGIIYAYRLVRARMGPS